MTYIDHKPRKSESGCSLCGEATLGWHFHCHLPVCPDCRIAHVKRCPALMKPMDVRDGRGRPINEAE